MPLKVKFYKITSKSWEITAENKFGIKIETSLNGSIKRRVNKSAI